MPDWLSIAERGLKAVRYGIFQASDNISLLLDGLCCAPEEPKDTCGSCGRPKDAAHRPDCCNPDAREFAFDDVPTNRRATPAQFLAAYGRIPSYARDSAAASPAAAVVAPSPKQGSDSPPRDSAIPPAPSGGTQPTQTPSPQRSSSRRQRRGFPTTSMSTNATARHGSCLGCSSTTFGSAPSNSATPRNKAAPEVCASEANRQKEGTPNADNPS